MQNDRIAHQPQPSAEQATVDRIVAYLKERWNPESYGNDFPVSYAIDAIQRGDWK